MSLIIIIYIICIRMALILIINIFPNILEDVTNMNNNNNVLFSPVLVVPDEQQLHGLSSVVFDSSGGGVYTLSGALGCLLG